MVLSLCRYYLLALLKSSWSMIAVQAVAASLKD